MTQGTLHVILTLRINLKFPNFFIGGLQSASECQSACLRNLTLEMTFGDLPHFNSTFVHFDRIYIFTPPSRLPSRFLIFHSGCFVMNEQMETNLGSVWTAVL